MSETKRLPVGFDLTGFVADRYAKIATTYTGGFTRVQYAAGVCTNVGGLITLPAEFKAISDGSYAGDDRELKEALAMSYINHEMGHDDVELRLIEARDRGETARSSRGLYLMVPDELRSVAFAPGAPIRTTREFLDALPRIGRVIAVAYGGLAGSAAKQIRTLVNAAEDPRQEAIVSARWPGAKGHLLFGLEFSLERWKTQAEEIIASGKDQSFLVFSVGLVYVLHGREQPFGAEVQKQVDAVTDLVELYKAADWRSAHGFFDAVNFALAAIGRVYRQEIAAPAPEELRCPKCGSANLRAVRGAGGCFAVCLDCGEKTAIEVVESEPESMEEEGPEVELDHEEGPSDGLDESEVLEDEEGEDEQSEDEEGEVGEGDESDLDDGEDDELDLDEYLDDDGDDDGEEEEGGDEGLKVGSIIRVKETGQYMKVVSVDGDEVEVEPFPEFNPFPFTELA